jgi:hypothetical protein
MVQPGEDLENAIFPAPFGPIRLTMDRLGMPNDTSFTATRPPKRIVMWSAYPSDRTSPARQSPTS